MLLSIIASRGGDAPIHPSSVLLDTYLRRSTGLEARNIYHELSGSAAEVKLEYSPHHNAHLQVKIMP